MIRIDWDREANPLVEALRRRSEGREALGAWLYWLTYCASLRSPTGAVAVSLVEQAGDGPAARVLVEAGLWRVEGDRYLVGEIGAVVGRGPEELEGAEAYDLGSLERALAASPDVAEASADGTLQGCKVDPGPLRILRVNNSDPDQDQDPDQDLSRTIVDSHHTHRSALTARTRAYGMRSDEGSQLWGEACGGDLDGAQLLLADAVAAGLAGLGLRRVDTISHRVDLIWLAYQPASELRRVVEGMLANPWIVKHLGRASSPSFIRRHWQRYQDGPEPADGPSPVAGDFKAKDPAWLGSRKGGESDE